MNTKQLVVMWYIGFAFLIILLTYFPVNDFKPLIVSLFSIIVIAVLLIITLKRNGLINRKKVLFYGIIPVGLIVSILFFLYNIEQNNSYKHTYKILPTSKIEVFDLKFSIKNGQLGKKAILLGRLKNNSKFELTSLAIRIQIHKLNLNKRYKQFQNLNKNFIHFFILNQNQGHLDSLSDTVKKYTDIGRIIDSETFYWDAYVEPGEVESFEMESYPSSLRPTDIWTYSYRVKSAWSGSL